MDKAYYAMKLFAAFLSIALCASVAHAGEVWVSPYSHTQHYGFDGYYLPDGSFKKYEDSHPAIGIEYVDSETRSIEAGAYRDSYGGTALYVARHWRYRYGLGAVMGVLVSESYPSGFVPFVGPEITLRYESVKVSAGYLPSFGARKVASVGVVKFAIKIL